jgi:hypothetical protein
MAEGSEGNPRGRVANFFFKGVDRMFPGQNYNP